MSLQTQNQNNLVALSKQNAKFQDENLKLRHIMTEHQERQSKLQSQLEEYNSYKTIERLHKIKV